MRYFIDAFKALRTTLRTAFRPTTTVEFPAVVRPRAARYRASFALVDDEHGEVACVACQSCEKICPSQVIKVKSAGKRESAVSGKKRAWPETFVLDLSACIQCELCIQVCNTDAIIMVREPEQPVYLREDLVLSYDRLRENAKLRTASWGRGTDLLAAQDPKPKDEKKPAKPEKPAKAEGESP